MISEELKEKNYSIFEKYLKKFGVDVTTISDDTKNTIKNGTFSNTSENRMAYDGSLLNVVINVLTPIALEISKILDDSLRPNKDSIIKVCLLSQIAKCETLIKNDNQWEIEKRGILYKYAKSDAALKCGIRSLIFAQNLGVKFTLEEVEAMIVLDRTADDKQAEYFSNQLSTIVRQANELLILQARLKN